MTTEHGDEELAFTPQLWREIRADMLWEDDDENRSQLWAFAAWGSEHARWWTCPRWYDVFAAPYESALADEAIQLAWWLKAGCLEAVAELPLDPQQEELARWAYVLMTEQEAARVGRCSEGDDER